MNIHQLIRCRVKYDHVYKNIRNQSILAPSHKSTQK